MTIQKPAFQFSLRHPMYANPPGRTDSVVKSLQELIRGANMECFFSALGGGTHIYGVIWRETTALTLDDRDLFESWLKELPITCDVQLSELTDLDDTNLNSDISDREFSVDNLSDEDRQIAADKKNEIAKKLSALRKRD